MRHPPFDIKMVKECADFLSERLKARGTDPEPRKNDVKHETALMRQQAVLEVAGDPYAPARDHYSERGVRIGVEVTMPRTPALYEEKVTWKLSFE